ncbi:MAG: hypothetical protein IIA45_08600 [Bacteroidetes bacterium]|nr:hypothetical protein [Bacteroidota bacterium]
MKKIYLGLLISLLSTAIHAQVVNLDWFKSMDGSILESERTIKIPVGKRNLEMKENVITVSSGVINKIKFKYEKPLNHNVTIGSFFAWYYGTFPGPQIAPIIRYYIGTETMDRIYMQAKVLFDFHGSVLGDYVLYENPFLAAGGGVGFGYQVFTGKNDNIVIDIGIGLKILIPFSDISTTTGTGFDNLIDAANWWYITGPGSVFDGLLAFGYAF